MADKKGTSTVDALLLITEKENIEDKNQVTKQNINTANINTENEQEECEEEQTTTILPVNSRGDFANAVARMKDLKPDHKTKMEVDADTNKKIILLSRTLGVNGYAVIGIAVNEFLEKYKKEIDRAMKLAMK